jgi:hypothetical protein
MSAQIRQETKGKRLQAPNWLFVTGDVLKDVVLCDIHA